MGACSQLSFERTFEQNMHASSCQLLSYCQICLANVSYYCQALLLLLGIISGGPCHRLTNYFRFIGALYEPNKLTFLVAPPPLLPLPPLPLPLPLPFPLA